MSSAPLPLLASDVKQRKGRISCDLCRRMKIKCDRQDGKPCSNCRPRGGHCVVTSVEKKSKVKRAQFLHSIESRIDRMEALLESSKLVPPQSAAEPEPEPEPEPSPKASTDGLEKELANLVINKSGEQKYIGPSSGFSIFSPRGLAWMQRKLGSDRMTGIFSKLQLSGPMWPSFRFGQEWTGGSVRFDLPPRDVAIYLVDYFFQSFNSTFPLFAKDTFMEFFERQYSGHPPEKKSWYGALNIVLSIGCILHEETEHASVQTDHPFVGVNMPEMAWRFFQNACSNLLNILFLDFDLLAVQTLVGMAFVMQALLNPEGVFVLIGMATRIAVSLGLHRKLEVFGLSKAEMEQRQRVFWIMYIVDKDMSVRIGRPSCIDDKDIELDILSEHHAEEVFISVGPLEKDRFYPFQSMCSLAIIQSKIYRELYAVSARRNTASTRLESISRLDTELQEWKEQFPLAIRPEHPIQCDSDSRFSIVVLHYGYYHCLTAIHRVNAHHELWTAEDGQSETSQTASPESSSLTGLESSQQQQRAHSSYTLCLAAARSILHLSNLYLDAWNDPRNKLIWLAPYFPLSAFFLLFTHLLQSPLEPRTDEDIMLMECALACVGRVVRSRDSAVFRYMTDAITEIMAVARIYIRDVRLRSNSRNSQQDYDTARPQTVAARNQQAIDPTIQPVPAPYMDLQAAINMVASTTPTTSSGSLTTPVGMEQMPRPIGGHLGFPDSLLDSNQAGWGYDNESVPYVPNPGQLDTEVMADDPFLLFECGEWDWST